MKVRARSASARPPTRALSVKVIDPVGRSRPKVPSPLGGESWQAPSEEERGRLARLVTRVFQRWGLQEATQLQLIGLHPSSRGTLREYRDGKALPASRDLIDRAGNLLAIHQSLRLLFPDNPEIVYAWIAAPNRDFGDQSPLAVMLRDGIRGVLNVRGYLDDWRSR